MTEDLMRFEDDLDRFGPDPAGWPVDARTRADRLLGSDPRAVAALDAARIVEAALRAPVAPASAELRARILGATAGRPAGPVHRAGRWVRLGVGTTALAASLLLGFIVGVGDTASAAPAEADAIGLLLGPSAEDYGL